MTIFLLEIYFYNYTFKNLSFRFSMNALIDLFCLPGELLLPRADGQSGKMKIALNKVAWMPKTIIFIFSISGMIYNIVNTPLTYGQVLRLKPRNHLF